MHDPNGDPTDISGARDDARMGMDVGSHIARWPVRVQRPVPTCQGARRYVPRPVVPVGRWRQAALPVFPK